MPAILLTALQNWKLIVAGIVAAGVAGVVVVLLIQRDAARADEAKEQAALTVANDRNAVLQNDNAAFAAQVAKQNAAVAVIQAQAAQKTAAASAALDTAKTTAAGYQAAIAARDAAPIANDTCAASEAMLDKYLKDGK